MHGAGHDHGLPPVDEQVEDEGGLLDAVGPLRNDDASRAAVEATLYLLRESTVTWGRATSAPIFGNAPPRQA